MACSFQSKGPYVAPRAGRPSGRFIELPLARKAQLGGVLLKIGDGLDAVLLGDVGADDEPLAVGGGRLVEPREVELARVGLP